MQRTAPRSVFSLRVLQPLSCSRAFGARSLILCLVRRGEPPREHMMQWVYDRDYMRRRPEPPTISLGLLLGIPAAIALLLGSAIYLSRTGDQINTNPLLGPLQDNGGPTFPHALLPGSPAIDVGNPNFRSPPYDQRGCPFDRVFNGRIDISSFETQPPHRPCAATPRPRQTPAPRPTPPQ